MINTIRSLIFWFFLFFFVIVPLSIIGFVVRSQKAYQKSLSFFSKLLLLFSWIRVKKTGLDKLKKIGPDRGLLIAANHQSFLDTFVLLANLPFPVRVVVHPAGFKMPFLRFLYKNAGYIGLAQKKRKATPHLFSLFKALQGGEKVLVYSVPTADRKDFMFTPALIQLAKRFNVPILPIRIEGTKEIMPMDRKMLGPGRVSITARKPAHFSSPAELKKEIY